jgi:hypothetical protein
MSEESPPSQLAALDNLEQAFQRQLEPFLLRVKQMTLEIVDEVGEKHGKPFLVQMRDTLVETVGAMLKTEVAARLDKLRPAVLEGGDALRKTGDTLLADLKQFITTTVTNVFQDQIPNYSSRAGRRMIDYFLAGTLLCLAAVLLCLGVIQGLEHFGVASFLSYLIGGGGALAVGMAYLKLRARNWRARERESPETQER